MTKVMPVTTLADVNREAERQSEYWETAYIEAVDQYKEREDVHGHQWRLMAALSHAYYGEVEAGNFMQEYILNIAMPREGRLKQRAKELHKNRLAERDTVRHLRYMVDTINP